MGLFSRPRGSRDGEQERSPGSAVVVFGAAAAPAVEPDPLVTGRSRTAAERARSAVDDVVDAARWLDRLVEAAPNLRARVAPIRSRLLALAAAWREIEVELDGLYEELCGHGPNATTDIAESAFAEAGGWWWVSWYNAGEFEYHGPWWVSGREIGGRDIICAAVAAPTADAARQVILAAQDDPALPLEWRFVEFCPAERSPFSGRFPRGDCMRWPWPANEDTT